MKLIVQNDTWADEIDFSGFLVCSEKRWERIQELLDHPDAFPIEVGIGTNEQIEYDTKKQFISTLRISDIGEESACELYRLLINPKVKKFDSRKEFSFGLLSEAWQVIEYGLEGQGAT